MNRPIKVTPELVQQMHALRAQGLKNRVVGAKLGVSGATVQKALNGRHVNTFLRDVKTPWNPSKPAVDTKPAPVATTAPETRFLRTANKLAPASYQQAEAVPNHLHEERKEDPMLLVSEGLKPETRQHFKLPRNPFIDDVQSCDDVFQTPSVRYVRAALGDCAQHSGFVAVVGESGAGKTTLVEDLDERIRAEGRDILIIKPYVLGMEGSDERGKTLKSMQIAEAIACAIEPGVTLKTSSEARFRQVHQLLVSSRRMGRKHLLLIEEAHCLPIATLKHLKRWIELKDGLQRLLGVALIGQPELNARLCSNNAEVREVAQRCEIVTLDPLDTELEGYLQHKFIRFDLKLSAVFTPDAFDAIRARLIYIPRGGKPSDARSICFPLVVNNLVCRAMNIAARAGWPQVDAQVIASC